MVFFFLGCDGPISVLAFLINRPVFVFVGLVYVEPVFFKINRQDLPDWYNPKTVVSPGQRDEKWRACAPPCTLSEDTH